MKKVKIIGYWERDDSPGLYPHPRNFIDHEWEKENRGRIVDYLRSGYRFLQSWDYAGCCMDPERDPRDMGSSEMTDGVYAWPEGLAVYVADYGIVLPEEFVDHMKANDFRVPHIQIGEQFERDRSFWIEWCRSLKKI
jgi:hypothetical protein